MILHVLLALVVAVAVGFLIVALSVALHVLDTLALHLFGGALR